MTQIGHIYMLKMSPLHHFQVGILWSFPSLVTEGLRDDKFVGPGEKPLEGGPLSGRRGWPRHKCSGYASGT